MKNSIFVDVHSERIKVAVLENGELAELYVEKEAAQRLVGNIYKGRVMNVLPGMQAAFVNIGLEKNAYLFVGESMVDRSELVGIDSTPNLLELHSGDEIMVQIVKEQFGSKGVRITTDISLPGRYVVFLPYSDYIGISRKIENESRRRKLTEILRDICPEGAGFIVRTAAETASAEEIQKEALRLISKFYKICKDYASAEVCDVVYEEADLIMRTIRDLLNDDTQEIIFNRRRIYESVKEYFEYFMPTRLNVLKLYSGENDMFEAYNLNHAVEKLLKRKVYMKNGAYLIIDRTEALTVIDVNTGKYVGDNNLEETVFNTNLVAAEEIARQIRLRNIGGIIIVDFIDMDNEAHQGLVVDKLREELKKDRIKTVVKGMTSLGLVELTRKKARGMIDSILTQTCPYCKGDSYVYSAEYMIMKIRTALYNFFRQSDSDLVKLEVNPLVFGKIFSQRAMEEECEGVWRDKRIYVVPSEVMHMEKFNLTDCGSGVIDLPDNAKLLY